MNVDDLVEQYLAGHRPAVPAELESEFKQALAGYDALQYALGETILVDAEVNRAPPVLPDDYEIVRELGHGGMGVVYLANQKSLGRQVAVKVLRPGETAFGPLIRRFLEEAKRLARLRHPNIVSIHEIGQASGEPYFTMDYVAGQSLADRLAAGPLAPTQALAICRQAAEAVQHAHEQGIIHRDLKPGNILLDAEGRAYVSDFGLARDMTQTSRLTRSGEVLGTPAYMAPEQAQGQSDLIGEAADVHALGVILYEMLTGRPPYGADAPADVLVRLLREEPVPPRRLDRRIPRDLETICLKAFAKRPEDRYPTVRAFHEDIRRFQQGQPIAARRAGLAQHVGRWLRRHARLVAALTAVVAVTSVLVLALAPLLLRDSIDRMVANKTTDEILLLADEQVAAGQANVAVRLYRRALENLPPDRRLPILHRIVDACGRHGDSKGLLDAAFEVMKSDPQASFGPYEFLVASAVVSKLRAQDLNQSVSGREPALRPLQELAATRLRRALDRPEITVAQRKEAQATLSAVEKALEPEPPPRPYVPGPSTVQLPAGTVNDLLARAQDASLAQWLRGSAAFAAAKQLESAGQNDEALSAYRSAFELLTARFPCYRGMARSWTTAAGGKLTIHESAECQRIRDTHEALERLAPGTVPPLSGGIRLRLLGAPIPDRLRLSVFLELERVATPVRDGSFGNLPRPSTQATFPPGGVLEVGLVDGKYRARFSSGFTSYPSEIGRTVRRLAFDFHELPKKIEINGKFVELVVPVRELAEIELLEPDHGGRVNLAADRFRWSPVPGAARYYVSFSVGSPDGTSVRSVRDIVATEPELRLGRLEPQLRRELAAELTSGRSVQWQVSAVDSKGRSLAITAEASRLFLVIGELPRE